MIKTKGRRFSIFAAVLLAMLIAFPVVPGNSAYGVSNIDLSKDVSLDVTYTSSGVPVSGTMLRLYRVADVDKNCRFTAAAPFNDKTKYPVYFDINNMSQAQWKDLARTLSAYISLHKPAVVNSDVTDTYGKASFDRYSSGAKMKPGLYLMLADDKVIGDYKYSMEPLIISLPDMRSGVWSYNVSVVPKSSKTYDGGGTTPTPTYTTREVIKGWSDAGYEKNRPSSVEVQLLRNGSVYHTVTLNNSNSWKYTWDKLDSSATWTLVEKPVKNYNVKIDTVGNVFSVTNTYKNSETPGGGDDPGKPTDPGKPSGPEDPGYPGGGGSSSGGGGSSGGGSSSGGGKIAQTGQLWWPVPVMLLMGAGLVGFGLIRRKERYY